MTNKIMKAEKNGMSNEQVNLLMRTVARGATKDEFALYMNIAKRSGLDPFTKQVHFVKRRVYNKDTQSFDEVGTIQTGIDGYRAIAVRSGELAGIEDAIYDSEDNDHPNKATVTVYRLIAGQRCPFAASARWNEYAQTKKNKVSGEMEPMGQWAKMPYLMLAKCAEALALRKAFPNDLSGLYTNEEMDQEHNDPKTVIVEDLKAEETSSKKAEMEQLLNPPITAEEVAALEKENQE